MKIGSIVIDCSNFDRMLAFWREALHYVPRARAFIKKPQFSYSLLLFVFVLCDSYAHAITHAIMTVSK
jgi:hypothetical protein